MKKERKKERKIKDKKNAARWGKMIKLGKIISLRYYKKQIQRKKGKKKKKNNAAAWGKILFEILMLTSFIHGPRVLCTSLCRSQ